MLTQICEAIRSYQAQPADVFGVHQRYNILFVVKDDTQFDPYTSDHSASSVVGRRATCGRFIIMDQQGHQGERV